MTMQDPVADMLTRIRNAQMMKHAEVSMPSSKLKVSIAEVLKSEGYIKDFSVSEEGVKRVLTIILSYTVDNGEPVIAKIRRISLPSRRVYSGYSKLPKILNGLGISIVSTSKGVMSGQQARAQKLGGELLCYVY